MSEHTTENDAADYPHATHPNHWERHGHPGGPCRPGGNCYGGATGVLPPGSGGVA